MIGEERCRVALVARLNDMETPETTGMMCAVSLGYIGDEPSLTTLLKQR